MNKYIAILSLFCVAYFCIDIFAPTPAEHYLITNVGILGIAQYVFSLWTWKKTGHDLLSPYIMFLSALYIFSVGQGLLYPLNLVSDTKNIIGFLGITEQDLFKSELPTLIMLSLFHIGALGSKHFYSNAETSYEYSRIQIETEKLKGIGIFLFIVSAYPYISDTVTSMISSIAFGYGSTYGIGRVGIDNMSAIIGGFFIPSVICLFIANKDNKLKRTLLLLLLIAIIIMNLTIGRRSYAVILLCLVLVMYNYLVKKFSRRYFLVGVLGGFIFLQLLATIAETRTESHSVSISEVKVQDNAAIDAIAEMGLSQMCLIKTMEIVPQKDSYRYGKSYLYSLTTIIPNLGFWKIHPAKTEANMSEWLTNELGVTFGTGFSMCAEAWVNFGYWGVFLFFIFGRVLGNLFGRIDVSIVEGRFAYLAFLLIMFWFCLILPRNSFISVVRSFFYYAGPIYLYASSLLQKK